MGAGIRRAYTVRAALTLAVMALPLCAASAAQASIAGGNPSTTTQLPDLRSATATSASDVQVCFDKPLSQSSDVVSNPTDMYLDGYASDSNYLDPITANIDSKNVDCVDLVFDARGGQLDLGQFTVATVDHGAVETTGGQVNLADSTTLLSSTTHNGTAGLTNAPDLVGPAPVAFSSSSPNTIEYVFDQSVDPASIDPSDFFIEDATGTYCYGQTGNVTAFGNTVPSVSYSGNDVYITFNGGTGACDAANARRAGVKAGGVSDVSSDEIYNPLQGTSMPNNAGTTTDADLISAVLQSSGNQVTYTFDKPVTAGTASDFFVALSNGQVIDGTSTSAASPDAITVTFNGGTSDTNLANYDEYAVQAGVDSALAAKTSNGSSAPASLGAVPIGGNSGAFARGFTTGPDAYALTFNPTQHTATIYFDQRVADYCQDDNTLAECNNSPSSSNSFYIDLLNGAGSVLGPPSSVVVPAFPNPGPEAVTMDVDPAVFAQSPTQVALGYDAFGTALSETIGDDDDNVPQIIAATATSGHLRPLVLTRARHRGRHRRDGRKARRAHRARRARTRT
jgi:hypothetical protein